MVLLLLGSVIFTEIANFVLQKILFITNFVGSRLLPAA